MAAASGLPLCRHGVMGETGISTLASYQVLASTPNQAGGHQVMHQLLEHDVVAGGVPDFEDGHLPVGTAPGPGVELDGGAAVRHGRAVLAALNRRRRAGRDP